MCWSPLPGDYPGVSAERRSEVFAKAADSSFMSGKKIAPGENHVPTLARAVRPGREMKAPRNVNASNLVLAFNITANSTRPGLAKHALCLPI